VADAESAPFSISGAQPFAWADVRRCLGVQGGLALVSASEMTRLDVAAPSAAIDLLEAVRIARRAAGLEANP
jgi:hypothetical protein